MIVLEVYDQVRPNYIKMIPMEKTNDWNLSTSSAINSRDKSKLNMTDFKRFENVIEQKKELVRRRKMCFFVADNNKLANADGFQENKKWRRPIKFRCSIYEKKATTKQESNNVPGISLSEFCRSSAFENSFIERLTSEQLAHYQMLLK